MRLFSCQCCTQLVYFENVLCTRCGAPLGFIPDQLQIAALAQLKDGSLQVKARSGPSGGAVPGYRHCANRTNHQVCNWLVGADDDHAFCLSCRLNHTIPDLSVPGNVDLWRRLETEKRRLVYSLLRLDLPFLPMGGSPGMAFDFLADTAPTFSETGRVLTGHAAGLITLNVAEADPVLREKMRARMAEPYRTILGHFRHESGHYYWDRLVANSDWLQPFRTLFGDETQDYSAALQQHYDQGAPANWQQQFVSTYASSHPWEDWAETWAHYLHMVDTLETAYQFGLEVRPRVKGGDQLYADPEFDPYRQTDFQALVDHWLPLTYALNSLNRSMGHRHLYPFVLAQPALDKLHLVHRLVQGSRDQSEKK